MRDPAWVRAGGVAGYLGFAATLLVFLLCRDEMLGLMWLVVVPLGAYMALSRKVG